MMMNNATINMSSTAFASLVLVSEIIDGRKNSQQISCDITICVLLLADIELFSYGKHTVVCKATISTSEKYIT